jgi:hypothetical protein
MSYNESKLYQAALEQLCLRNFPRYFLTLHFHAAHPLSIYGAQKTLRHFAAQLDHKLLGNRWASFPPELRTRYLAVPEGRRVHQSSPSNPAFDDLHYHLTLSPAEGSKISVNEQGLRTLVSRLWAKCAPAGDVNVQFIRGGDSGRQAVTSYICKRVSAPDAIGLEYFVVA